MGSTARASRLCLLAFLLVAVSPAIALAANNVVVDGQLMYFYPGDAIDNLTVINGGIAVLAPGVVVNGNLTVDGEGSYAGCGSPSYPDTDTCVAGNATITDGGRLSTWFTTIGRNFRGDDFGRINFLHSHVVGSIRLSGGEHFNGATVYTALPGSSVGGNFERTDGCSLWLEDWTIGGSLRVSGNTGPAPYGGTTHTILIAGSQVSGNVQVSSNHVPQEAHYPSIEISDNTVGGNLRITDNSPTPVVSGNTVYGNVKVD